MQSIHRRHVLGGAAAAALGFALPGAFAENLHKNARVTVGFPPGDMADSVARLVLEQVRGNYADAMIVDNKPGAAARMAITQFTKYKADGSELLFTPGAMIVLFPHVFEKLSYDPLTELKPVTKIATASFGLAVGPAVPAEVKTLDQYLAWARKDPKNASYGTSGAGTGIHLTAEYLARLTKTPLTMVAYRGASLAVNDLIAGQIPAQMATIPSLIEHVRGGRARFIAVSSAERLKNLPDVPTFKELGRPELVTDDFFGFFLPASGSNEAANAMNRAVLASLKDAKVIAGLESLGLNVSATATPAEFSAMIAHEYKKWGEIAKRIDFKPLA
ncbi:twin-arginine translocation pathway signal protein [Ramlibacter sp. USB13]|uniref:Twin-arginine translocation pathway signal protein n=1 Tax=Ramlibacter cellulosilyticus TaxID=2764187 RepID=A0A923MMM9_9BURK|nr:tripartite tricarboxylate transporter substrate-binding protein [Ramlibacter cellulosilyticus]MBC5781473.1 twin-arginine translocation pathway signal protein [Ramlibacter cellulosilyticus]